MAEFVSWFESMKLSSVEDTRPWGEDVKEEAPEVVQALLVYLTAWSPPLNRVLPVNAYSHVLMKRLKYCIMSGRFHWPDLFLPDSLMPSHKVFPEVAMLVVQDYLKALPGRLLSDSRGWHTMGHTLLLVTKSMRPYYQSMPYTFLRDIKALRRKMSPGKLVLLDQIVCSIRSSAETEDGLDPETLLKLSELWAPVLVSHPRPEECLSCAYKNIENSSQGTAHALFYLARWGIITHKNPFFQVWPPPASRTSEENQHGEDSIMMVDTEVENGGKGAREKGSTLTKVWQTMKRGFRKHFSRLFKRSSAGKDQGLCTSHDYMDEYRDINGGF